MPDLMVLAAKNLRFGFGDHTILVGVATPHRKVEFFILSGFNRLCVSKTSGRDTSVCIHTFIMPPPHEMSMPTWRLAEVQCRFRD
jgi:hypothetical protein